MRLDCPPNRIKEQLQCCEALLSIDDRPHRERADVIGLLLQYDGSEEVRRGCIASKSLLGKPRHVLPERLPQHLSRPDVRALEERYEQLLGHVEHLLRRSNFGQHS